MMVMLMAVLMVVVMVVMVMPLKTIKVVRAGSFKYWAQGYTLRSQLAVTWEGWGEGEVDEEMVEEDDHGTHAKEGKDEAEEGK